MDDKRCKVLVGVTGSVATIRLPALVRALITRFNAHVRVVATQSSLHFFTRSELPEGVEVFVDADEYSMWRKKGDPVLHIELRKWADVFLIAPLDANTLAKLAHGMCDNLLTCVARAWDLTKPFIVAPAMNTHMWNHPFTQPQLEILKSLKVQIIDPISKVLVCGDIGTGAMAEVDTIVEFVHKHLEQVK